LKSMALALVEAPRRSPEAMRRTASFFMESSLSLQVDIVGKMSLSAENRTQDTKKQVPFSAVRLTRNAAGRVVHFFAPAFNSFRLFSGKTCPPAQTETL
ncbi:MAG: hypothetical protein K6E40_08970, partial [Desulfovibrio sp.]|nr:hypothetical protein [Desulfovibrio sp.]